MRRLKNYRASFFAKELEGEEEEKSCIRFSKYHDVARSWLLEGVGNDFWGGNNSRESCLG